MDLTVPLRTVAPSLDAEALSVLARTEFALTGRRVAQLAKRGSQPGIQRVLDRLVSQGIVDAQDAGSAVLYRLNRDHLLAEPLIAMVTARDTLLIRLRDAIEAWQQPCVHASVFGSVARGQARSDSDIDVLLVRPTSVHADGPVWQQQLADLETAVRRWTGNPLSWFETTTDDLGGAVAAGEPVLESWRDDALHLAGTRLVRLLDHVAA